MKPRSWQRAVLVGAVVVLGLGLIAAEVYVLSPGVRAGCVGPLERAGRWDTLAGMLADDDQDVRAAASDALARHPAAVPALARGLDRLPDGGRAVAAWTLGQLGPDARAAVPALKHRMVADDSEGVREAAARALGRVGRDDPATVSEVLGLLEAGDPAGRLAAARAASELNDPDKRRAVPSLAGLLRHPDPRVREEAAETLGGLGADAAPAVPALLDALGDPDPRVRQEAGEALQHYAHGPNADPGRAARIAAAVARSGAAGGPRPAP